MSEWNKENIEDKNNKK